jgi:putative NADPH-quinone reductase
MNNTITDDILQQETTDPFVLFAIPPTKEHPVYQEARKLSQQMRMPSEDIYKKYFLIEKINVSEEYNTWIDAPRMVIVCPLINFYLPHFLQDYLLQLTGMLQNTPDLVPKKELLLIITTTEPQSFFTNEGKNHTTVYDLLLPIKVWADAMNIKFLVPKLIFSFKDNEITLNNIRQALAEAKYKHYPFIATVYENDRYIHKIMRE